MAYAGDWHDWLVLCGALEYSESTGTGSDWDETGMGD